MYSWHWWADPWASVDGLCSISQPRNSFVTEWRPCDQLNFFLSICVCACIYNLAVSYLSFAHIYALSSLAGKASRYFKYWV